MSCLQNPISRARNEILLIWYPMIGKELSQIGVFPRRFAVFCTSGVSDVRNFKCICSVCVCVCMYVCTSVLSFSTVSHTRIDLSPNKILFKSGISLLVRNYWTVMFSIHSARAARKLPKPLVTRYWLITTSPSNWDVLNCVHFETGAENPWIA
jgi:hypothetical protein